MASPAMTKLPAVVAMDAVLINPVEWSDAYLTNVPLIDTQHRRLFELIEELRMSFVLKRSQAFIHSTLHGLVAYCEEHFESEELLLQTVEYPIYDSHAQLHRTFEAQTRAWAIQYENGSLDEQELIKTLIDWLVSHVMTCDFKYADYLREKGINMAAITSVSTLADFMAQDDNRCHRIPLETGLVVLTLPSLVAFAIFAFWNASGSDLPKIIAACVVMILLIGLQYLLYRFVKSWHTGRVRLLRVPHARRLAENLLAGEIAVRVSTMNLDDMENLFGNSEGTLVQNLKDIVDHLAMFLPYLPASVLAMIRGEDDEDPEAEARSEVLEAMGVKIKASSRSFSMNRLNSAGTSRSATRSVASSARPAFNSNSTNLKALPSAVDRTNTLLTVTSSFQDGSVQDQGSARSSSDTQNSSRSGSSPHGGGSTTRRTWAEASQSRTSQYMKKPELAKSSTMELLLEDAHNSPNGPQAANGPAAAAAGLPVMENKPVNIASGGGGGGGPIGTITSRISTSGAPNTTTSRGGAGGGGIGTGRAKPIVSAGTTARRLSTQSGATSVTGTGSGSGAGGASKLVKANIKKQKDMLDRWLTKKNLSLMVAEIAQFEASTLTMKSEDLIELHAKYVVLVQEISKATRGVFNTLIGDRVVVTWNAATNVGNHAEQACNAALTLRDAVSQKSKEFAGRKLRIAVGSGVSTVGNMGSKTKLSFSVIGPVSTLCEALCALNLYLQTEILISAQTWRDVRDMFITKMVVPIELLTPGKASSAVPPPVLPPPPPPTPAMPILDPADNPTTAATTSSSKAANPSASSAASVQFAIELKDVVQSETDEWMYQIQDASQNDPFKDYHEAIRNLFLVQGQAAQGLQQLKEYVDAHGDDIQAKELLRACRFAFSSSSSSATSSLSVLWRFGWIPPPTTPTAA